MKMGLGRRISLGAVFLLIPLVVALAFLVQYGAAQIRVAALEIQGLETLTPLYRATLAWQAAGSDHDPDGAVEALVDDYADRLTVSGPSLGYDEASFGRAGFAWSGTEDLKERVAEGPGGRYNRFAGVHQQMLDDLLYLSQSSGLILDPDVPSHLLILALYQTLPQILNMITDLGAYTRSGVGSLSREAYLTLYSRAWNLGIQARTLRVQLTRSLQSLGPDGAEGYAAWVEALLVPFEEAVVSIESTANAVSLGEPYRPEAFAELFVPLLPLLAEFHAQGVATLGTMLSSRVQQHTAFLATAFAAALAGLLVGAAVFSLLVLGVHRRTVLLQRALSRVASGDLTQALAPALLRSGDQTGALARSVERLQNDLREQWVQIQAVATTLVAIGEALDAQAQQSSSAVDALSHTVAQVDALAVGQQSQTASERQAIASMLEGIVSSHESATESVGRIGDFQRSLQANRLLLEGTATEAHTTAALCEVLYRAGEEGEASLSVLRTSISSVVGQTQDIQAVAQIILDIADRSNLLSMNAAIEAAHAGLAGRGFAVVADEIRRLAETSAEQARAIKDLLTGVAMTAERTLGDSDATAASFQSIRRDIASVRGASQGITEKVGLQVAEDAILSREMEGLLQVQRQLSTAIDEQMVQSYSVQQTLGVLELTSSQIGEAMHEQKQGMDGSVQGVSKLRQSAHELTQVIQVLHNRLERFRTEG